MSLFCSLYLFDQLSLARIGNSNFHEDKFLGLKLRYIPEDNTFHQFIRNCNA
jgi:hypothetical protein